MNKKFNFLVFILNVLNPVSTQASFSSNIFSYDHLDIAKGLHVCLKGDTWVAEDVKWSHFSFQQSLFDNPDVMSGFADGQTRTSESVEVRFKDSIENRFAQGHPHGLLTVRDKENNSLYFMHAVAGGGDRAGTAEIAYAISFEHQGKKLGTKVITSLVQEWAPEVRRIGLGQNIDQDNIVKAFKCFGGKELENLDATASPTNLVSWKILEKAGFYSANYKLDNSTNIDFDLKEISYKNLEEELLKLYDSQQSQNKNLKINKRYCLTDMDGKQRIFSKHQKWNRIKFHFEKSLI